MGVYHLMGLGRSPGSVTGPLSYLAYRYQRWNADDQQFFSRSGEAEQREKGKKVGDVQSLVLFTTPEVIQGTIPSFPYLENQPGQIAGSEQDAKPMKEVLRRLLKNEWSKIRGEKPNERPEGSIFLVAVDRRNINETYKRIVQVIAALAKVGGQGKEMWVNLTGGNNVTNFALQLAATLSGEVARLYYIQAADNAGAEKCVRFTDEKQYWVELPVLPLDLNSVSREILKLLDGEGLMDLEKLHSHLSGTHWNLLQGVSSKNFREIYLSPMWKQGLIVDEDDFYTIGSQWELIKPYSEILQQARQTNLTLEQLAQQEDWIEWEKIKLN